MCIASFVTRFESSASFLFSFCCVCEFVIDVFIVFVKLLFDGVCFFLFVSVCFSVLWNVVVLLLCMLMFLSSVFKFFL